MAEIGDAVSQCDAPRLRRAAHTLKGAVGNFGAAAVQHAAQRLESMGQEADLSGSDEAYKSLQAEVERLLPALTALTENSLVK
jgi:HPt (histidine-containing phosphotransfer) domain-containing protein